jgi:hypothetical protein
VNVGQAWEGHKTSLQYVNWELSSLLKLNDIQVEKINAINAACDFELEKVNRDEVLTARQKEKRTEDFLLQRSEAIMKILNDQQQELLYAYCAELLAFNKMFE